jgi:hypothetical protein
MSQRMGMADGRCYQIHSSSRLINNYVMQQEGINMEDNYSYRQYLQRAGPTVLDKIQAAQGNEKCNQCHTPLLNLKNTY